MENEVTIDAVDEIKIEKEKSVFFRPGRGNVVRCCRKWIYNRGNKALIQTTAYTKKELTSNALLQFIHPADQLMVKEKLASLYTGQLNGMELPVAV